MGVKPSFWEGFTNEGRLKKRWMQALEETDPNVSLSQLREVQQQLQGSPVFIHLWLPFLDTFFERSRIHRLMPADLMAVEEMGNSLAHGPAGQFPIRPEDIWFRVLAVYRQRGEEQQAYTLFARIYYSPSASVQEKTQCARELAHRGVFTNVCLGIYIDYLQHIANPASETEMLALLSRVCTVDFDTDAIRLKLAYGIAQQLVSSRVPLPLAGVATAIGLYTLVVGQNPSEAATYFGQVLQREGKNKTALIGLLVAWMQLGMYQSVIEFMRRPQNSEYIQDAVMAGLLQLNAIMRWLDRRDVVDQLPAMAQSVEKLKSLGLSKYVDDLIDGTLGRIYLLVGNARRASELFRPLLGRGTRHVRWYYYAAWAETLIGNRDGVAHSFTQTRQWSGRWTIGCLLLDIDRGQAQKHGVQELLEGIVEGTAKQPYHAVIAARLALGRSIHPPTTTWEEGVGQIEEDMEALRTMIGVAFYNRKSADMERWIAHPLFYRLPLADQMLWRGLLALYAKDRVREGLRILEQAAVNFGYYRAALILAMYFLEHSNIQEAKRYLNMVITVRTDSNVGLLMAYIHASQGQTDTAIKQLEQLVTQARDGSKAQYALGSLLLQKAAQHGPLSERSDTMQQYRERAAKLLQDTLKVNKESLPDEAESLTYCAQFVAYPHLRSDLRNSVWDAVSRLDTSRQQSWFKWNAMLARLWYGTPPEVMAARSELNTVIDAVNGIKPSVVETFAQALAHVADRIQEAKHADTLVQMLERLSLRSELPAVKRSCQLGITMALQVRYRVTEREQHNQVRQMLMHYANQDTANGQLSLLLTSIHLENSAKRAALTSLRNAQPQDPYLQRLCLCLADLLEHRAPSPDTLPPLNGTTALALKPAHTLLHVAAAFAGDRQNEGYALLSTALRQQPKETTSLVNLTRILPALCAYTVKEGGSAPSSLIETIRNMSLNEINNEQAVVLARCAAAVGEVEHASRLWEWVLTSDKNSAQAERQEYAKLLCHLAVVAHQSGDDIEAARRLRQASQWLQEGAAK